MNCSAEKASRKWANGAFGRSGAAMVTVAAAALMLGMQAEPAKAARRPVPAPWGDLFGSGQPRGLPRLRGTQHRSAVPLPKPRPAEAPAAEPGQPAAEEPQAPAGTRKPSEQAAPAPQPSPEPSACRLALTDAIAIAPSIPDIHGAGGCGGEDLVRLEAIVLPDKRQVAVKPAAILRCAMASALADWIRTDIAPLAQNLGSAISDLDNFNSFECRGRNRVVGAQTFRARPRQRARCSRLQARQRPIDLADRSHRAARSARNRAAFGMRAVFDRARSGLGLVPRGPHPSRPDGAAQQLPDLPVECVGPAAAGRAAVAGGAAGGSAAARGRRQIRCSEIRRRQNRRCAVGWREIGSGRAGA